MDQQAILSNEQIQRFKIDGCLLKEKLFTPEEISKLYEVAVNDKLMTKNANDLNDQSGFKTRLSLWFTPGDDIYGLLTRSARMVRAVKQLLDSDTPVCHYHSKLMQKEPRVGGAWEWHQDYGYWYKNQFMFPDQMLSVLVALTPANKENGCLQVIKGSHKIGRINHGFSGEQMGAEAVWVEYALQTMPLVYCEMQPGDALFFHSNILHRSEANLSAHPRWSLISVYNSQSNIAYNEKSIAYKVPVDVVADTAILQAKAAGFSSHTDFLKKDDDPALKATTWDEKVA